MQDLLAQLIPFFYIGIIIYLANQQAATGRGETLVRMLVTSMAILPVIYAATAVLGALNPAMDSALPEISLTAALISLVIAVALALVSLAAVRVLPFRVALRRVFGAGYDPNSLVHLTAFVLVLALTSVTLSNFALSGGLGGLAEEIQADTSAIPSLILTQTIWILSALLGVGLLVRRTPQQAAARLGLRFPRPEDFNWGLGYGLLCYVGVIGFVAIWALLTSPELFAEQTAASQQLVGVFSSIPQVFVLSILIGIGEEVFFRGAIQPVFGIGFTSVFFAVLHTQYTLTPATLALFGVSLVLGWLRQRHSTSAAIIAHFIYNFVQLFLGILVTST
ncbi:MAG: CPBP family intramembrane metalloprotease [Chloroflexi bacterium]|nr:CPBP family intramembrane metalloprotease [Chloroflexota bacterium]